MLAGLGLYLAGLNRLASSMQPLIGRRVRALLARLTRGPVSSAVAGSALGALSQSTSAAAFVCIGLLNSGALSFRRALSLSAWASVGTSLLVFLAAVDVRIAGLYAIGAVGLAYLLNAGRFVAARDLLNLVFAIGILLVGLGMIKDSGGQLRDALWLQQMLAVSADALVLAFLFGLLVTLVVQSSATITILAVSLNIAGVMPLTEAVVIVCGASVGSGLSLLLATSNLLGPPRQLALWQCVVKVAGVAALLPLLLLLPGGLEGLPGLFDHRLGVATLIALIYLMLQVAGAGVAELAQDRLASLLERWVPLQGAQARFAARYIYDEAARDSDTALALATREQDRLIAALPEVLDPLRPDEVPDAEILDNDERLEASRALTDRIGSFIADTASQNRSDSNVALIFGLQSRNESIRALQDSLHGFVDTLSAGQPVERESGLACSMVEGLHLCLVLLADSMKGDAEQREVLLHLCSDRGELMEEIRGSLLAEAGGGEPGLAAEDTGRRQALFVATGIFERVLWLMRQLLASRLQGTADGEMAASSET